MATKKPEDYQTPAKDVPVEEPLLSEHLEPEEERVFPEKRLHGVFRYMGAAFHTIDHYGVPFDRGVWVEVYDPFIAKKCRGNTDFDTQGKDSENADKAARRAARETDREEYARQQDTKKRRAERNADAVLGRD